METTKYYWLRQPPLAGVYMVDGTLDEHRGDPQPISPAFPTKAEVRAWWHAEALKPGGERLPAIEPEKPLGRFSLEEAVRLTPGEIRLLAEIDAPAIRAGIREDEKTEEDRAFEADLLKRLLEAVARQSKKGGDSE